MHGDSDLPFFFFQRVLDNGSLEVRSPGGYVTSVSPHDVCDVIPGEPLSVRAMPERAFLERLKCSTRERQQASAPECFAEAYVLYANKDRWGRPDFYVWFANPEHNTTGRPWRGMLMEEDRRRIEKKARRTIMPVSACRGSANYSADFGCQKEADYNRYVAKRFIAASLGGCSEAVAVLSVAGTRRLSLATINRLIG